MLDLQRGVHRPQSPLHERSAAYGAVGKLEKGGGRRDVNGEELHCQLGSNTRVYEFRP